MFDRLKRWSSRGDDSSGIMDGDLENAIDGMTEDNPCELSYQQRMIGFGITVLLAFVLFFVSLFLLGFLALQLFAITYSLCNISLVTSTFFLVGLKRQLKTMFANKGRAISVIVFVVTLVLTLVAAIVIGSFILAIIMAILQFLAFGWYALSYIPFGQQLMANCCKSLLDG
eukprot:TRINITY_DN3604_c0_g1_i1.p1 TRINITY_DN3604_c0_g1~~TRINITY_DN3604_c0_g1_i1.p1  ORF type:complete len:171 (+),score=15.78 TRINITY_DN3604_c0_g1_i1:54-566(+)